MTITIRAAVFNPVEEAKMTSFLRVETAARYAHAEDMASGCSGGRADEEEGLSRDISAVSPSSSTTLLPIEFPLTLTSLFPLCSLPLPPSVA
eukprot:1065862-Rhodomonas_salina.1